MAPRGTTFGKLERDRAKKARAAAKRERREERQSGGDDEAQPAAPAETRHLSQEQLLERLQDLHERFDDGQISFEDFEKQKATLIASLAVD